MSEHIYNPDESSVFDRIANALEGINITLQHATGVDKHEDELSRVRDQLMDENIGLRQEIATELGLSENDETHESDLAAWFALPKIKTQIRKLRAEHRSMRERLEFLNKQGSTGKKARKR